ncbi:MAG: hypothetical protein ACKV0T_03770 [Planctomycetales bacterium]
MLLKAYLVMGLVVGLLYSAAAISGRRLFNPAPPGVSSGAHSSGGGGFRGVGGYHSTWHGGK